MQGALHRRLTSWAVDHVSTGLGAGFGELVRQKPDENDRDNGMKLIVFMGSSPGTDGLIFLNRVSNLIRKSEMGRQNICIY